MHYNQSYLTPEWRYSENLDDLSQTHAGFIYLITNMVNGRMYVGRKYFKVGAAQTESDWKRYWSSCKPLIADLNLFGLESFQRAVLQVYKTKDEVNIYEVAEQTNRKVLTTLLPNGIRQYYNGNIHGEKFASKPMSDETRKKLSDSRTGGTSWNKGIALTDDQKRNISLKLTGRKVGPRPLEVKQRISATKTGVLQSEEAKAKMRAWVRTEEHKAKLRRPLSEEHKAKMRKPKSEEAKQAYKIAQQRRRLREKGLLYNSN